MSAKWRGWLAVVLLAIGAVYIGLALMVIGTQTPKQSANSVPTVVGKAKPRAAGKAGNTASPDPAKAEQKINESFAGVMILGAFVFLIPGFYLVSRWWAIKRRIQEIDYLGRKGALGTR